MAAASLAMSAAESTEIPTSAIRKEGASLIPSPRYPTTWPRCFKARMRRPFCSGVKRAKTLTRSTT
ncbi:hypothetical protein D3C78_1802310 [compost metagenome]